MKKSSNQNTIFLMCLLSMAISCFSQHSKGFPIDNSNWVATDALGRTLPTYKIAGDVKSEKLVGLFYYIWHGSHTPTDTIYDLTKKIAKNPTAPEYGPNHAFHYWGEPEAGYYWAGDPG